MSHFNVHLINDQRVLELDLGNLIDVVNGVGELDASAIHSIRTVIDGELWVFNSAEEVMDWVLEHSTEVEPTPYDSTDGWVTLEEDIPF